MSDIFKILMTQIIEWGDCQFRNLQGSSEEELWDSYNFINSEVEDLKALVIQGMWSEAMLGLSLSTY